MSLLNKKQSLQEAVRVVMGNPMSQRKDAKHYKINKSVIQHYLIVNLDHQRTRLTKTLTEDEEYIIFECQIAGDKFRYPYDLMEFKDLIGEYVRANDILNAFKDNTPGEDWYLEIMKGHLQLTLKNRTSPDC